MLKNHAVNYNELSYSLHISHIPMRILKLVYDYLRSGNGPVIINRTTSPMKLTKQVFIFKVSSSKKSSMLKDSWR